MHRFASERMDESSPLDEVVGGVQGVTNEPCCEPYDDLVTVLSAAILKSCADERQSTCSLP